MKQEKEEMEKEEKWPFAPEETKEESGEDEEHNWRMEVKLAGRWKRRRSSHL